MPRAKKWFLVYEDELDSDEPRGELPQRRAQRYLLLKSTEGLLKKRSEPLGRIKEVSLCLALLQFALFLV